MNYQHVTDPDLRNILSGATTAGPEEIDYAARSTIGAWETDQSDPDLEPHALATREQAVDTIHLSLGDGDDGNSRVLAACRDYWSA